MRRPHLSVRERLELWDRWRRGESLSAIARALGRVLGTVHHVVGQRGGISPAPRRRAPCTLSSTDREEISRALAAGASLRAIAQDDARRAVVRINRRGKTAELTYEVVP